MRFRNILLSALLVLSSASAQAAPLPDLRVQYHGWNIGRDGAKQELSYSERVYRRDGKLWIEREIPKAAQPSHEGHNHGGLGHKHDDVAGAPLWIERGSDGKLQVRLVDHHEERVIAIDLPNYGNIGFSGSWAEAYHLIDPAHLSQLKAIGPAKGGVQRYEAQKGDQIVRVEWDVAGQYAREVSSEDRRGLSGRTIKAARIAAPPSLPWASLGSYKQRDYSDLLD
jgi:hypothetical protein